MTTMKIKIDSLVTEGLQIRLKMVEDAIERYSALYRENPDQLPPIIIFYDSMLDKHYLGDGFHRLAATMRNDGESILAEIREGTLEDARRFAIKANAKNGIMRTKEDEFHAMEIVWNEWDTLYIREKRSTPDGEPSRSQLMELCGVTEHIAKLFLQNKRSGESPATIQKSQKHAIIESEVPQDVPNALTVTKDHLEERNPEVRALLKEHKDRFGVAIPDSLWSAFLSREPQEMLKTLRGLRKAIETHHLNGNRAFANSARFAMTHFNNLIRTIECGEVYCVCPVCRGASCIKCFGHGFMTHDQHKQYLKEKEAGLL